MAGSFRCFLTAPPGAAVSLAKPPLFLTSVTRSHLCLIFEIMRAALETGLQSGSKRAGLNQSIKSCQGLKVAVGSWTVNTAKNSDVLKTKRPLCFVSFFFFF